MDQTQDFQPGDQGLHLQVNSDLLLLDLIALFFSVCFGFFQWQVG